MGSNRFSAQSCRLSNDLLWRRCANPETAFNRPHIHTSPRSHELFLAREPGKRLIESCPTSQMKERRGREGTTQRRRISKKFNVIQGMYLKNPSPGLRLLDFSFCRQRGTAGYYNRVAGLETRILTLCPRHNYRYDDAAIAVRSFPVPAMPSPA